MNRNLENEKLYTSWENCKRWWGNVVVLALTAYSAVRGNGTFQVRNSLLKYFLAIFWSHNATLILHNAIRLSNLNNVERKFETYKLRCQCNNAKLENDNILSRQTMSSVRCSTGQVELNSSPSGSPTKSGYQQFSVENCNEVKSNINGW